MPSKPRLNEKLRLAVVALAGSPVFKKIHSTTALFKFLEDIPKISSEMKDKLSIGKTTTFIVQKLLPLRTWHTINKLVKSEIALLLCRVGAHFQNFQKGHASLTGLRDVMHLLEEAETFQRENGMLKNLKSHLQKLASYNFEREVENNAIQNWVKCDSCGRWRDVPNHIKLTSDEEWRCNMATWTRLRCDGEKEKLQDESTSGGRNKRSRVVWLRSGRSKKNEINDDDHDDDDEDDDDDNDVDLVVYHDMTQAADSIPLRKKVHASTQFHQRKRVSIVVPPDARPNSNIKFTFQGKQFTVTVPDELELKRTNRTLTVDLESIKKTKKKKKKKKRRVATEIDSSKVVVSASLEPQSGKETKPDNTKPEDENDENHNVFIRREIMRCLTDPNFPSFVAHVGGFLEQIKRNSTTLLKLETQQLAYTFSSTNHTPRQAPSLLQKEHSDNDEEEEQKVGDKKSPGLIRVFS